MRYRSRSCLGAAGCALLLATGLALAAGKAPGHLKKGSGGTIAEATYTDSGPEPLLAKVFDAIEANRLDLAMQQTDMLIKAYPNFRLAHLVKGDLLLARSRHLMSFGEGGGPAAGEKVADLRDEAVVRLKGYRTKPPADYVPRYLLQMHPEQKHAVVVDTQKSRLYLYQNDNGTPRFVADYYISQGKLGADKTREGDRKTPIGVYHVTANLPRRKLTDFYGAGAYPINYPNAWDKRLGRNGHGIWLHGTPSDTYSRPPRASDGCIVLANTDLEAVGRTLQIGLTPVIIADEIEWTDAAVLEAERKALAGAFEAWRADWESRNSDKYLAHYAARFHSGDQSLAEWSEHKRKVNGAKSWIKVAVSRVAMMHYPRESFVVVSFDQDYRSSNLSNVMRKRQYWVKNDGRWRILYEGGA